MQATGLSSQRLSLLVPKSNVNRKPIKGIQQLNCQIKYRTTCIHELHGCVSPSESPRMTGCTQATDNILKLSAFVSVSAFYHIFVSLICHISTISWVVINILKGFTEWAHKYLGFSLKAVPLHILYIQINTLNNKQDLYWNDLNWIISIYEMC